MGLTPRKTPPPCLRVRFRSDSPIHEPVGARRHRRPPQELWRERVIKPPQLHFEVLIKSFKEKLTFVQQLVSTGGDNVFPTFSVCQRTLKQWQQARVLETGAPINNLRRAKTVLKDEDVYINIDKFLDTLAERRIISVAQEIQIRDMSDYHAKIDAVFKILFAKDVERHYKELIEALKSMDRLDIVRKIQM
ncbi:unnamed protein product [Darwinula stevensoni]|uniref:Uncharacterized protein n=1 Tax=Darwinula stevensoni TaxID=69355 RepID=A0A7R9A927_9CRUS|nr:unnamed protein product [Darwinula stevensoni]CAG0896992.1 unnamed protein product [Darwinula stevensoni]